MGGEEKIKFPKQKKIKGKKNWEGGGEKTKLQKKLGIKVEKGMRKGKQKKSAWDGTWIEKRILLVHHPSMLVHWWVLVHSAKVWIFDMVK